tara:strand:- start:5410 stop:7371 length:1962 start_codon:yes stop_codon:yes gene_type:complete
MVQIPAYRKLGIQGFSVPGTSFAGLKEQANMFNSLNQKIGSLVNYANDQVSAEMQLEGQEYAVGNPITLQQYYDANPTEIAKQIEAKGGNDSTVKGRAIKATLLEVLSTNVIIEANSHIGEIYDNAVVNKLSLEELENKLNGAIDGYYQSIVGVSPEAGLKIKSQLGIKANTYHRNYATKLLNDGLVQTQSLIVQDSHAEINDIPEIIRSGALEIEGVSFDIDTQLEARKLSITNNMIANNFSESQVQTFQNTWNTAVIEGKKNFLQEIQRDLYPDENGMDFIYLMQNAFNDPDNVYQWEGINELEDGPAKEKLIQAESIFNSLEDKEAIYTNAMNQVNQHQTRMGILNSQIDKAEADLLNKKTLEFTIAMANGNLESARTAVEFLATNPVYADQVDALLKVLQSSDSIGFNTPNLEDKVRTQILTGSVNVYDIYQLIENNDNGFFGSGTLKLETINTLIKEAKAQNSANVTKAMKIVKGKIKNMPQDIANSDTWSQENKIAMQLYERVNIALLEEQMKYEDITQTLEEMDNPFNATEFVNNIITNELDALSKTGINNTVTSITTSFPVFANKEFDLSIGDTVYNLQPITKDIQPAQIDQWITVLQHDLDQRKDNTRVLITEDNGYTGWSIQKAKVRITINNLKTLKAQLAQL